MGQKWKFAWVLMQLRHGRGDILRRQQGVKTLTQHLHGMEDVIQCCSVFGGVRQVSIRVSRHPPIVSPQVQGAVIAAHEDLALFPRLLVVFPTLHLVYGAGVIVGLLRPRYRNRVRSSEGIEIRRVKAFGERLKP